MAVQTIRTTQWGWNVGGVGTDATVITTGQTYVKRMIVSSEASADTFSLADAAGNVIVKGIAGESSITQEFEIGAKIKGLTLTMSSSVSRASIFVE